MTDPVIQEVTKHDVSSAIAVAGHPIHAMLVHFPIALVAVTLGCDLFLWLSADPFWQRAAVWSAGGAFVAGVIASAVGLAELLLVTGIRKRIASWSHGVVAVMLVAVIGMNWGMRVWGDVSVIPYGLALSVLALINVAFAGYHGGKLVFDHGVGIMVSSKD
jgi:uncharacterized membrane protein